MHKYRNLTLFILVVFGRSLFVGMIKFFLRSYLKEINSLEQIAWYISLGWTIAYLFWGGLAYAFTKKKIMIWSAFVAVICLLIGYASHYSPFFLFALLVSIMWFVYALRLTIKSIIVSTEILNSWLGETVINGITNISMLLGFLLGSYRWFASFGKWWGYGFLAIIAVLCVISVSTLFFSYDRTFSAKPFILTLKSGFTNIMQITEHYFGFLLSIGILRAVSTATAFQMLEIGMDTFNKMPKSSISIIVLSFVGIIAGNIISAFFKKNKKIIAIIFLIILGWSIMLFPHLLSLHTNYLFLKWYSLGLWLVFGICVNIIEGRYFHRIGEDQKKEFGSAAYGLITWITMFFVMIIVNLLNQGIGNKFAFFFCGIITIISAFFLKDFNTHIPQKDK